jgi:hypothetical protein
MEKMEMWRFDEYDDVLSGESVGVVVIDEYPRKEVFDNLGRSGRSGVLSCDRMGMTGGSESVRNGRPDTMSSEDVDGGLRLMTFGCPDAMTQMAIAISTLKNLIPSQRSSSASYPASKSSSSCSSPSESSASINGDRASSEDIYSLLSIGSDFDPKAALISSMVGVIRNLSCASKKSEDDLSLCGLSLWDFAF